MWNLCGIHYCWLLLTLHPARWQGLEGPKQSSGSPCIWEGGASETSAVGSCIRASPGGLVTLWLLTWLWFPPLAYTTSRKTRIELVKELLNNHQVSFCTTHYFTRFFPTKLASLIEFLLFWFHQERAKQLGNLVLRAFVFPFVNEELGYINLKLKLSLSPFLEER